MHRNRLANLILNHWKQHRPQMVAELMQNNTLEQAVQQAEIRAAETLFDLLSEQKMQYQEAWELAMQECLLPEESKSSVSSLKSSLPETSG